MTTTLTFLGAAESVTGSKYLLETGEQKILVDCGLFQGLKELRLRNWEPFPIPPAEVNAVVLTHAHLDHSGYLPILVRQGFTGPIYATPATYDLCKILLRDAGRIQEEDAMRANKHNYSKHKPALPLYTEKEAIEALKQFKPVDLYTEYPLGKELTFYLNRAGHIIGSSIVTLKANGKTLVFSGDLGRQNDTIMKKPDTVPAADYLILESTYGNRLHSEENAMDELGKVIRETVAKGGVIVIPSFAVGRTQTVLYLLYQLKEANLIPSIPIFLDSPMAQDATDILLKYCSEHRIPLDICAKVGKVAQYVQSGEDSKRLNADPSPKIIISASGMAEGGRVLHHIKFYGPSDKNSIVFTGFQAPMTRGDLILKGAKKIKIFGEEVPIRFRAEALDSLSSHADYEDIIVWLKEFKTPPKKVFLTHGELEASESLRKIIVDRLGWDVVIPKYMERDVL